MTGLRRDAIKYRYGNGLSLPDPRDPRVRPCPKCEAPAGKPCRLWRGGRIRGEDVGGGYWVPMSGVHPERRKKRIQKEEQ